MVHTTLHPWSASREPKYFCLKGSPLLGNEGRKLRISGPLDAEAQKATSVSGQRVAGPKVPQEGQMCDVISAEFSSPAKSFCNFLFNIPLISFFKKLLQALTLTRLDSQGGLCSSFLWREWTRVQKPYLESPLTLLCIL